jgi:hypothetical protein
MAEAREVDPFINTDQVDEDEAILRLLDEDCSKIDEGSTRMLTPEEVRTRFHEWLISSPTPPKH